jgi:hypothetical protein
MAKASDAHLPYGDVKKAAGMPTESKYLRAITPTTGGQPQMTPTPVDRVFNAGSTDANAKAGEVLQNVSNLSSV